MYLEAVLLFVASQNFRFIKVKNWGFVDFRLGNGISYITKKYDPFENKKNIAIGSHINGFVNLQFSWIKQFNRVYFGGGIDFSHISNAKLKTPNQGLNTLTGFLTAGFNMEPRKVYDQPKFEADSIEVVRKFSKWHFHFYFRVKTKFTGSFGRLVILALPPCKAYTASGLV